MKIKYAYFLVGFILLFLLEPLVSLLHREFPVADFLFILIISVIFLTSCVLNIKRRGSLLAIALTLAGLALEFLNKIHILNLSPQFISLMAHGIYAYFIAYAIYVLTVRIFSERSIDFNALCGGILIYFLIGVLWVILYRILLQIDPAAFNVDAAGSLFYFSYTTLTTVGYGDIYPVSHYARILSNAEAISGQIFLAVFIGRLVGLYIVQEIDKK